MIRILLVVMIALLSFIPDVSGQFWYGVEDTVPLIIDSTKVTFKLTGGIGPDVDDIVESVERIVAELADSLTTFEGFVACTLSTSANYMQFIDSLESVPGIYLVEPYYLNEDSTPRLVGEKFCVGFNLDITEQQIDSLCDFLDVVKIEQILETNVWTIRNTKNSNYHLLDLANMFYDLPETRYSHPNFLEHIGPDSDPYSIYDYYNIYQWHLKRVIGDFNSASVWDFAGLDDTIIVAVIDDGIDDHEDLTTERILSGLDFADNDDDPSPSEYVNHGMCCAGIIAASHEIDSTMGTFSNSGIISINPIVKILPIKIFCNDSWFGEITTDHLALAISWAYQGSGGNADVLSNSWNYIKLYEPEKPTINEALHNATQYGRPIYQQGIPIGFRGCPVIFSAGNSGTSQLKYPARLPYCFAVGAIDSSEARYDYSSYGPDLDLVTYSSDNSWEGNFWSLDQMGDLGRNRGNKRFLEQAYNCGPDGNNTNYDCLFGGTSAACPVVSGTASLILAKDPTLTADEVYDILRHSAVKDLDWEHCRIRPMSSMAMGGWMRSGRFCQSLTVMSPMTTRST